MSQTWPVVSIGIPVYNRAGLVHKAVESVIKQDYAGDIHLTLVDDGSTDDTLSKLSLLRDMHESGVRRISVHAVPHRGIAVAKNEALDRRWARVVYGGILDSDDWYDLAFVRRCVEELEAHPEIGLVYTDNVIHCGDQVTPAPALDWGRECLLSTCNLRGDSWLARWSLLDFFRHDERLMMEVDYDLFYQLSRVTEFRRIAEPLHHVLEHPGRATKAGHEAAYWHAVCLGKHGFSSEYALKRAERWGHQTDWRPWIDAGYRYGIHLRRIDEGHTR